MRLTPLPLSTTGAAFICWAILLAPANHVTRAGETVALIGGRVATLDQAGTLDRADVVIAEGKIVAVGPDLEIPADARRIDVSGMIVTPGLIDVRSTLGLTAPSARQAANDASLQALDGVDAYADDWREVARHGVTAVYVQPAAAGNLGGSGAVLRVAGTGTLQQRTVRSPAGVQAALGTGERSANSSERYAQYERVRGALEGARKYREEWRKWDEAQPKKAPATDGKTPDGTSSEVKTPEGKTSEGQPPEGKAPDGKTPDGKTPDSKETAGSGAAAAATPAPKKPARDPGQDLLVQVLEGSLPLRIEVRHSDDALNALKLAEEFKIRLVLEGLAKVDRGAWQRVHAARWPLVAGPVFAESAMDRADDWLAPFLVSDGLVAVGSFSGQPRGSSGLRTHAALAVAQGMSPERALRGLTLDAARVLGVDDRLGSLTAGKQADLAVFAGDPLDPAAPVRLTMSAGEITFEGPAAVALPAVPHAGEVPLPMRLPDQFALKTRRLLMADGQMRPALVVVAGGNIVSVGMDLTQDPGVPVFDLSEAVLGPGLVSFVTLPARGPAETVESETGYLRAVDAFDPAAPLWNKLLAGGVTTVIVAPPSTHVMAGQLACIRPGDLRQPVVAESAGALVVLDGSARQAERFPATLNGQLQLVNQWLDDQLPPSKLFVPDAVAAWLQAQQRQLAGSLVAGQTTAAVEVGSKAELQAALQLIRNRKLRACLVDPRDFGGQLEPIRELGVGLIVGPLRPDDFAWVAADWVAAAAAGIPISFGGERPEEIRYTAAALVAAGMRPADALRSLTASATAQFQLERLGRVEPGAPADLVIWSGSPLDVQARPRHVLIAGQRWKEHP